jgi:hypothetical protein
MRSAPRGSRCLSGDEPAPTARPRSSAACSRSVSWSALKQYCRTAARRLTGYGRPMNLWVVREAKASKKSDGVLNAEEVRQAETHPRWIGRPRRALPQTPGHLSGNGRRLLHACPLLLAGQVWTAKGQREARHWLRAVVITSPSHPTRKRRAGWTHASPHGMLR